MEHTREERLKIKVLQLGGPHTRLNQETPGEKSRIRIGKGVTRRPLEREKGKILQKPYKTKIKEVLPGPDKNTWKTIL